MNRLLLIVLFVWASLPVAADTAPPPTSTVYLQGWLGGQDTDESWRATETENGESVLGDLGTLPFGGGAAQRLWGSGAWQIGYEGGGLMTWKSDRTTFFGTNSTVVINVDSEFVTFGAFFGGVISVMPSRYLRLYVAGGPSATWAWLSEDGDNDDNVVTPAAATVDLSDSEGDGSFTAYARGGIEVVLDSGLTFGASVRYAKDEFDFGNAGELELDEPLWLFTVGSVM